MPFPADVALCNLCPGCGFENGGLCEPPCDKWATIQPDTMKKKTVRSMCLCGATIIVSVLPDAASAVITCPQCGTGYELVVTQCPACSATRYIVARTGGRTGDTHCQQCVIRAERIDEERRAAESVASCQQPDTLYGQNASASIVLAKLMFGVAAIGVVVMAVLFRASYLRSQIEEAAVNVSPIMATSTTVVTSAPPVQDSSSNLKRAGDMGTLFVDSGGPFVAVPKTEAYLDEMVRCSINKDKEGFAKMVLDGKVWDVEQNTPVRVIGFGGWLSARYKIRITSGQSIMQEGWVPYEWVK